MTTFPWRLTATIVVAWNIDTSDGRFLDYRATSAYLGPIGATPVPTKPEVPSVKGDKKKQSLYFPVEMLDEMQHEADRQERPLSWIMQQAWKLSRDRIMTYPAVDELNA
jgi:uncharacterized small protein (TIGR04563 family)